MHGAKLTRMLATPFRGPKPHAGVTIQTLSEPVTQSKNLVFGMLTRLIFAMSQATIAKRQDLKQLTRFSSIRFDFKPDRAHAT
jgi:hypothetical protein